MSNTSMPQSVASSIVTVTRSMLCPQIMCCLTHAIVRHSTTDEKTQNWTA